MFVASLRDQELAGIITLRMLEITNVGVLD